jgi:hypothetical protein
VSQRGRRWSRPERIADVVQRFELPRPSLAECVLQLVDAGYDEQDAVTLMRQAFQDAVFQQRAYGEPWIAQTDELVTAYQRESAGA